MVSISALFKPQVDMQNSYVSVVLYVIILSAALDLVPPSTPKGIIAFCNIAPSLVAKVAWPYLLRGKIQYERRLIGCCTLSFLGMLVSSPSYHLLFKSPIWLPDYCPLQWSLREALRDFLCIILFRSVAGSFLTLHVPSNPLSRPR